MENSSVQSESVYADLHTHTTYSDGALDPETLVDRAKERGVQVLSVTDHDTVEALERARSAATKWDLRFVAGVELSVTMKGDEVHVLGYAVDPSNKRLRKHLREMAEARRERVRRMIERLRDEGIDVHDDGLAAAMSSGTSVGRPHVASALVRCGQVDTVSQAFNEYLDPGRPAFVAKPEVPGSKALSLIHEAGGVGVLAHPGHWTPGHRVRELVEAGLDGIETIHPSHTASLQQYYERLARGYDLLETGGSDFHGAPVDENDHLGTVGMSKVQWERFREAVS